MRNKGKTIFCVALILQPLVRLYGLPAIGGTFADYIIIGVALYIILRRSNSLLRISSKKEAVELLPIMVCVAINIVFTINRSFGVAEQLIYWMRYCLYYFVLIYGVKSFYDVEYGYRVYQLAAYACTIFLFVQIIASSVFSIYIPGQFGSLALTDIEAGYEDYLLYLPYNLFRPDSFFEEPAHYATFVSGYVMICSLREVNKWNIFSMILCSLGVLLSGSTTGLAMVVLIWIMWFFRLISQKKNTKYICPILILVLIAMSVAVRTNTFQIMIDRTFNSESALNSRFSWIDSFTAIIDNPIQWFFGLGCSRGVIELAGWLPGWPLIIIQYGIMGVIFFVSAYFLLWIKANKMGKLILIYFIILGCGTEAIVDVYVLVVLPFVIQCESLGNWVQSGLKKQSNVKIL